MIIDKLCRKILEMKNPSTIGLDTDFEYLPLSMKEKANNLEDVGNLIFEFNKNIIDNIKDIAPSVKVQIAYYEMYGVFGMKAFYDTCKYASENGLIVIADAKRNDIGSTAGCYSKAFLGETTFNGKTSKILCADFLTVNGYLGSDGLNPFIEDCKKFEKGLFALVKTSNPSSGELQNLKFENGNTLFEEMANLIEKLGIDLIGEYGYSSIGAVVGATHKNEAELLRKRYKNTFFLIPGYGAQGGKASELTVSFDNKGLGGIVNSSRAILCAYKTDKYKHLSYYEAARQASIDMRNDIVKSLNDNGIFY